MKLIGTLATIIIVLAFLYYGIWIACALVDSCYNANI